MVFLTPILGSNTGLPYYHESIAAAKPKRAINENVTKRTGTITPAYSFKKDFIKYLLFINLVFYYLCSHSYTLISGICVIKVLLPI
jgi:hypothetical protein